MPNSNLQAFNLTVSTLLKNPSHLLPNLTISTFLDLPEQLGLHLTPTSTSTPTSKATSESSSKEKVTIRALVLDKDNTLCPPNTITFPPAYLHKLESLRTSPTSPFNQTTNPHGILIVSNTAGSRPESAAYENEARRLEQETLKHLKIPVFRVQPGKGRKPFCGPEVLAWFREKGVVDSADQVAVVGDRLGTDVLMAAQMGAWSVWCKNGVTHGVGKDAEKVNMDYRGFLAKVEIVMERYLRESRGLKPRVPRGWEA
ncbi:mitochondrial PGP phosphatase [Talaromyces proteolyticus]|uniref:Mitochondrial PGP phosphatase n=1 Tax=Talaromyces proteolyticus TaxID=1131652 RepID=A0AAD4KYZ5_9EURO|nr:mitochondrial PGP phosphatase [Talaromyces proteolyticus]KAH8704125.1 mitochondrial PGP phosphatase [Talaromyces proteolyticus]